MSNITLKAGTCISGTRLTFESAEQGMAVQLNVEARLCSQDILAVRGRKELAILSANAVRDDGRGDCPIDRGDAGCVGPDIRTWLCQSLCRY